MKHFVFKSDDKQELKRAKNEALKDCYRSVLVQIFSSLEDVEKLSKLVKKITKKFPDAIVIGATTAGEIDRAKMLEDSTVISVSFFEQATLNAEYTDIINGDLGKRVASKIYKNDTKAVIVLSEGLCSEHYEEFVNSFNKQNPNVIVSGGLAGDNFKLKKTYIFYNGVVYDKGSVAVSLSSKNLYADHRYNLNWSPMGKEFTITKADKNMVYEIDGCNSVELFKKYLGLKVFENDARGLSYFQFLYKEGMTVVARTPLALKDNALVMAAPILEGQKFQFGFSNAASIISGSTHINNIINKKPAEAIYIYSCIARKTLLGDALEGEFENFESLAPTAGFFTYGEYYSTGENNVLLNSTTTILVLSESLESVKNSKTKKIVYDRENITFSAMTHFVEQTAKELDSNVKLLNQYKDAVDASLLVSKTDKNGLITYVNDNFCKVSGYTKEELIGRSHNIVRDERVSPFIFKKLWTTIKSSKVWRGQFPNRAKDGSEYYIDATIMPTHDDNDEIDGFIAIRQDITKQIQSKRRLEEKEKFIKAIFDNQDSIVILASKDDGLIGANKTLFDYLDFKNFEDFKAKHHCICEFFLKEEGYLFDDGNNEWLDKVLNSSDVDHKAKIIGKDRKEYIFNVKVNKFEQQYIVNLSDITNLENALQKAYSSEKTKSMFLANMSHEIRTPLNGILGFTDVLMSKKLNGEVGKYVDIIHKSGKTLLNIVNDILDFSKIESGEFSLYKTKSDLFGEMEVAVSTFASSAKNKNIDYFAYIDTNIPKELLCDVQRIKQVISNLISNAIKFTPNGGSVDVKVSLKGIQNNNALINFSIKDSGIGIPKDKLKSVFEAFSQADNSISRNFGGTGLGLSISRKFIDMMGGKLKVKSEEGVGSEFYFELDFPILNKLSSVEAVKDVDKKISILQPDKKIVCAVYDNVKTYLSGWKYDFNIISSLDELDDSIDLLIVCSKLFDEEPCKVALEKFKNIELIYVESGDSSFDCHHERFHLIAQPMTGSALFNLLISFMNYTCDISAKMAENKLDVHSGNILVAEDNMTNQMLIEVMLEDRGLDFKIVNNGQEAVDEAFLNHYDIIFMDINMPVLDGVSATKELRKRGYDKTIISLSANVIESDVKSYKEAGVNESLSKPIVPTELDGMLKKYLSVDSCAFKKVELKFDIVDVKILSEALSIKNEAIILKLLQSFAKSSSGILDKLKDQQLDKDILHNIKGISGNLRFSNLYEMCAEFEFAVQNWDEKQNEENKALIVKHLEHLIGSINSLNNE